MDKKNDTEKKGVRITKDLVIAALALRCPWRSAEYVVQAHCGRGPRPTNCNPRLCTQCTEIFRDMVRIAEEGIDEFI